MVLVRRIGWCQQQLLRLRRLFVLVFLRRHILENLCTEHGRSSGDHRWLLRVQLLLLLLHRVFGLLVVQQRQSKISIWTLLSEDSSKTKRRNYIRSLEKPKRIKCSILNVDAPSTTWNANRSDSFVIYIIFTKKTVPNVVPPLLFSVWKIVGKGSRRNQPNRPDWTS